MQGLLTIHLTIHRRASLSDLLLLFFFSCNIVVKKNNIKRKVLNNIVGVGFVQNVQFKYYNTKKIKIKNKFEKKYYYLY